MENLGRSERAFDLNPNAGDSAAFIVARPEAAEWLGQQLYIPIVRAAGIKRNTEIVQFWSAFW